MNNRHQAFDSKRVSHLFVTFHWNGNIAEIVQYTGSDLVTVFSVDNQRGPLGFGRFVEILNDATGGNPLPLPILLEKDGDSEVRVKVNVTEVVQNGIKHSR